MNDLDDMRRSATYGFDCEALTITHTQPCLMKALIVTTILAASLSGCAALLPPTQPVSSELYEGMTEAEAAAVLECEPPRRVPDQTARIDDHAFRCAGVLLYFRSGKLYEIYQ